MNLVHLAARVEDPRLTVNPTQTQTIARTLNFKKKNDLKNTFGARSGREGDRRAAGRGAGGAQRAAEGLAAARQGVGVGRHLQSLPEPDIKKMIYPIAYEALNRFAI